ncbi:MAG TPA: UDP-N-acetylmuramoyl-L-alanine--D-glutamate ligase [Patescibacteria group bacterium]|jgi:UDP-N-acetylmuramoylalanine--D-glutamate ligase|nr:UDP-N-acetylmuramoyl-L-alanine--D-glutamate ligase [Patescibacteria group bacterium]
MKVAIAGYGIEGKSNYAYWNTPDNELTIVDERTAIDDLPGDAKTLLGPGVFRQLAEFDLVVRTASLDPKKIHTNGTVTSASNEFLERCPVSVIGVTGTKGKGTTCSLITSMLRAAGKQVHLVGNIGVPALEVLPHIQPDDIVVYELSSFQLWDIRHSPHVAVVLPIEPDHLDIHATLEEYVAAKANIVRYQSRDDIVIYHEHNQYSNQIGQSSMAATKLPYPRDIGQLADALVLPGAHNVENASAAVLAVSEYNLDPSTLAEGLHTFDGLPHRLKLVAEKSSIRFYDDSISTTPGSSIAALASFEEPKVIILGGSDKGADYESIVQECKTRDAIVVVLGKTGQKIAELCHAYDVPCHDGGTTIESVVQTAFDVASPGGVVLLSPASASFDMFKNYGDRGDKFTRAAQNL